MRSTGSSIAAGTTPKDAGSPTNSPEALCPTSVPGLWDRVCKDFAPILTIAFQIGLILLIVQRFQIENKDLARVLKITLLGFVVHHFLPERFRLAFFGLLSMGTTVFLMGIEPGLALLAIGLTLIGLCHLPIPYWGRIALVTAAAVGLAVIRANSQWIPELGSIWAILGSMFAFRIMIYLYDLKHRAAPFSTAHACAYFFMIPNVCFPLFPIVDYKTFCSTYYNDQATRIYQVGIQWMFRGVIQLLLYRLVYQYGGLEITEVVEATGAIRFIVSTYLLYLKVSGQFHLIIGLVHLFGFNLSETHHLYYLASSLTDFWRRINIYWKDFIMKIFFYPAFFRLRKLGTLPAMALATMAAFVATWALHSLQCFWSLGAFLLTWQDIAFWSILAVMVTVNALLEAVGGRQRTLNKSRLGIAARLRIGLRAAGTFLIICLLWTLWSCRSGAELQVLAECLTRISPQSVALIIAIPAVICLASMYYAGSHRENFEGSAVVKARQDGFPFWRSVLSVSVSAVALLALPVVGPKLFASSSELFASLSSDQLNARDANDQRRGYYEELEMAHSQNKSWQTISPPPGWNEFRKTVYRERADFLGKDIVPGVSAMIGGAPGSTSQLGMRDREYSLTRPQRTFRAVLLGASHEFGTGVRNDETFENVVEDHLNSSAPKEVYERFEIMNMALGGESIIQRSVRLNLQGFAFEPDAVLLVIFGREKRFVVEHLAKVVISGHEIPYPFVQKALAESGVKASMPERLIQQKLFPYAPGLVEQTLRQIAGDCEARGTKLIVVYRPAPKDTGNVEASGHAEILELALRAQLDVIDLSGAFEHVTDRDTLILAPWDDHTNALGHRLLADKLYQELVNRICK